MRTEIFINGTSIDLYSEFDLSLNFAMADIKTPEKRNSSYSKTITIPGSKTNNKLFTYIFDISKESLVTGSGVENFTPDFNPNLKADCQIYIDSLLQLSGYVQLLEVKVNGRKIEYEIAVFGVLANIFSTIEGKKLTDIDFSFLDHSLTKSNIISSWSATVGAGYVYPMIDYGTKSNLSAWYPTEFYPAIYVKQYIDKIFEDAGFTYSSDFFDSPFFKRLIIPFNGEVTKLSTSQITERTFKASVSSDQVFDSTNSYGTVYFDNDSSGGNFDSAGQYEPSTGIWTVKQSGNYNINVNLVVDVFAHIGLAVSADLIVNNTILSRNTIPYDGTSLTYSFSVEKTNYYLHAGDNVYVKVYFADHGAVKSTSTFYNSTVSYPAAEGQTVTLNSVVPKDITQKDFLLSLIKMFNLYISPDPDDDNNLIIEPAIDYYSSEVVDWSEKLDTSKQYQVKPVSEIEGKDYVFTYKEDSDYDNFRYKDKWGQLYGTRDLTINNDFVKGEKKFELIFSPTPCVQVAAGSYLDKRVIPRFVKQNNDGTIQPQKVNIRILYYGGLKNNGPNIFGVKKTWGFLSTISTSTPQDKYPYCGHLDDPYIPSIDLLFSIPREVYWGGSTDIGANYTTNNIYNKYYKQFIEEITDKDSKLFTGYFRLKPIDVYKLDFRKPIYVESQYFRLNKIFDYNPLKDVPTKVELSKIKAGVAFIPGTTGTGTEGDPSKASLLDGGEDITAPVAGVVADVVDGGLNKVMGTGGVNSDIYTIDGGLD